MGDIETSIIIPTHNREKILKKCLLALSNQTYPAKKYEIIVINDGSTDRTENMINELNLKPNLVYRYQKKTGPAGARNRGIKLARGKYIIFIDDDIIVSPEFVEAHITYQREQEKVIVHGPVIYTNNIDAPTSEEMKITDYSRAFFATGNVSIQKKFLLKAGLFNETFTEYGWEDLELGNRLRRLGLKAIKASKAKGYHLKYKFTPEKLPALLNKEEQRGRMAILFFIIDPSWSVRMTTLYWKPFFWLKKVLTIGNWPEWDSTYKLMVYLHNKGLKPLRNFILFFMKLQAYFNGMKQGLDQQSQ